MQETEMWARMTDHFGSSYVRTWASSVVLADLGNRTVVEAIADGLEFKQIWRAVWKHEELPDRLR
ncbi:MAG TPA: DUF3046 domain-containing protein [Propionibacteriaceae bacterium]|nr:DUF3046 domain-containing protein [Propionibacteriaceae bacterium]